MREKEAHDRGVRGGGSAGGGERNSEQIPPRVCVPLVRSLPSCGSTESSSASQHEQPSVHIQVIIHGGHGGWSPYAERHRVLAWLENLSLSKKGRARGGLGSPTYRLSSISEKGGIEVTVAAMLGHPGDTGIQGNDCATLSSLARKPDHAHTCSI